MVSQVSSKVKKRMALSPASEQGPMGTETVQ